MNRRRFLGLIAVAPLAPVLSKLPASAPAPREPYHSMRTMMALSAAQHGIVPRHEALLMSQITHIQHAINQELLNHTKVITRWTVKK